MCLNVFIRLIYLWQKGSGFRNLWTLFISPPYSLILPLKYQVRKMVTITLYARQQKRHRCIEQSLDSVGEGEGGMIWENGIETCILSCEKNRQSRFDAWDRVLGAGALGWPRGIGWGGRWEGRFRMGNTCTPMADPCQRMAKPIQYCKVISLQLK